MLDSKIAIAGIGTDVGKTYVSAALCALFGFDYFKLVQAGERRDARIIKKFCHHTKIFGDGLFLKTPKSPHIGQALENKQIDGLEIRMPSSNSLLIELAGGLFSPLDSKNVMLDYLKRHKLKTLLCSRLYLGSINHTLLSIEALKNAGIELLGVIISGRTDGDSFIQDRSGVKVASLPLFNQKNFHLSCERFERSLRDSGIFNSLCSLA